MGETDRDRASSKSSVAPSRPTINLPPRASFESFLTGGSGFSPGPMTLISNLFSPDSDCRSFTQLLAGAMASPAAAATTSAKPTYFPDNSAGISSEEMKSSVSWDGNEKNWGFKQNHNRPMSLIITPPSPMFAIPSGLSPSGFLNSPGFFSPLQSPFGMSHQQALAHVTAQAAISQYRQVQPEYQPAVYVTTESSAPLPFAPTTAATQQQVQAAASEPEPSKIESAEVSQSDGRYLTASVPVDKPGDDGYNWRKYGQKQVKASEYPRSYYKCTHANCPVKKKVERSPDGQITEIIYKGTHNHDIPRVNKRSKDGEHLEKVTDSRVKPGSSSQRKTEIRSNDVLSSHLVAEKDQVAQQKSEQLPGSTVCNDINDAGQALNEGDDDEPTSKRRNTGTGPSEVTSSHKTVTEPKIVVQTRSEVDLLDDGYKWRKYGQKVVKGNPHPRSYYRCTYVGCNVRKHVERASKDPKAVITTYEGKHKHEIPAGRNIHNTAGNLQSKPQRPVTGKAALREGVDFRSQEPKHGFLQLKEEQVTA